MNNNTCMLELEKLISNELKLVALLSLPKLCSKKVQKVRSLLPIVDLERVREQVNHHRVWPSVYCNVQDHFSAEFPQFLIQWLEGKYKKSVNKTQSQFRALYEILFLFKEKGISAKPIKGIPLAQKLYGDITKRQSSDIDIIIWQDDLDEAHKVLINLGYSCAIYEELTDAQKKIYFDAHKDLPYKNGNGTLVELHVRLSRHSMHLANRVQKTLLSCANERVSREEEFLYLSWHGSHTLFHRLKWLVDIALYIEKFEKGCDDSFGELFMLGKKLDSDCSLVCSLILSHFLFATELPHFAVVIFQKDRGVRWMVKASLKALNEPVNLQGVKFKFERYLGELLSHKRFKNILLVAVQKAKPDILDLQMLSLPIGLSFIYYILRPFTLCTRLLLYK